MRVTTFKTFLNEDGHSYLVKEKAVNYSATDKLDNPQSIVNLMNDVYKCNLLDTEYLYMISMNTKCHPTGFFEITHGLVNASLISPREILIKALLANAVHIVIIHNHPSGSPNPSSKDISVTRILQKAFSLMDIKFADHIIIAGDSYYSFNENCTL